MSPEEGPHPSITVLSLFFGVYIAGDMRPPGSPDTVGTTLVIADHSRPYLQRFTGEVMTETQAHYQALILGLEKAQRLATRADIEEVRVYLSNDRVFNHLTAQVMPSRIFTELVRQVEASVAQLPRVRCMLARQDDYYTRLAQKDAQRWFLHPAHV